MARTLVVRALDSRFDGREFGNNDHTPDTHTRANSASYPQRDG